ncbi:MAG: universal stress protein [Anaerolineales bacterium]|nr:universal stress protein [Anaerolineales bacterium]MCB8952202.1 universal stress protein [Ardenticatenales bacterium]
MAHVSRKLSNSFEGALAGGGDPATSPLYVFGPFLRLIVAAGVAGVTFGASVWLVVLTVATVSAMYRLVMDWVTDGSGGSGLSEEEFGGWAVKVNAGITFIEYTLTFLVSMAALVTFIADRFPLLNDTLLGLWQYRTLLAIALSLLTGWLVNRGPKVAAAAFGPATAGVLLLLWIMIFATINRFGLQLPRIDWQAFRGEYLEFTFGGYVRILAVMTGIEVFANLVAAYSGSPAEKSRKAFGSLLIIMGTTCVTMLVVGPAIFSLADPMNAEVSVFTQTMDQLLPAPLAYMGTIVGVAVLLSACAASAQGLQNLALGLKYRHYIPPMMGRKNTFGVADGPVWLEVGMAILCFLAFGTDEETYLAIYAAGVFILLSMTGWAAAKRLLRHLRAEFSAGHLAVLVGTMVAAALTTTATIIIFAERFREGAWTYFLLLPILYALFSYFRARLGNPSARQERLGRLIAGSGPLPTALPAWRDRLGTDGLMRRILVPLDGSPFAEHVLPLARTLSRSLSASLLLTSVVDAPPNAGTPSERSKYLEDVTAQVRFYDIPVTAVLRHGAPPDAIHAVADEYGVDLVVMSTRGHSGVRRLLFGSVAHALVQRRAYPLLLLRPQEKTEGGPPIRIDRILVPLDGSHLAENVLPFAERLARQFAAELLLLSVPDGPEGSGLRSQLQAYVDGVAAVLDEQTVEVRTLVTGSGAARTILAVSEAEQVDLIVMATHGRGGLERLLLGSVAASVVTDAPCPVFLVPPRSGR